MFTHTIQFDFLCKAGRRLGAQSGAICLRNDDTVFAVLVTMSDAIMLETAFKGTMKRSGLKKLYKKNFINASFCDCPKKIASSIKSSIPVEDDIAMPCAVIDGGEQKFALYPAEQFSLMEYYIETEANKKKIDFILGIFK